MQLAPLSLPLSPEEKEKKEKEEGKKSHRRFPGESLRRGGEAKRELETLLVERRRREFARRRCGSGGDSVVVEEGKL